MSVDIQVRNHTLGSPLLPDLRHRPETALPLQAESNTENHTVPERTKSHTFERILIHQGSVMLDIPFHLNEANFFSVLQEGKYWCRMDFPADSSAGRESACTVGDIGTQLRSLGQEAPLEEEMTTHSSIPQSIGLQRVKHD